MGLSPYGEPTYYDRIRQSIINIKDDGSFRLNTDYFDYQNGRMMVNEEKMSKLFGGGRRMSESRITKREMDIAASVQLIAEEIILKIARYARDKYASDAANLVLAGGVALNCVANGKLLKSGLFKKIWIRPAAGDAGGALGAALYVYYHVLGNRREADYLHDKQKGSLLGPEFSMDEIKAFLEENRYPYHFEEDLPGVVARLLQDSKIIGLFQGKMEFGPRALGNRNIIADPRSTEMQAKLNLKIKFRESFRPFAPSVLKEKMTDYFDISADSPYMLFCAGVKANRRLPFNLKKRLVQSGMDMLPVVGAKRSDIPAVTHVDYSARIQSVDSETNRRYYDIIRAFERLIGCGVVVNTSFNVRGEPIVCTPEDAYRCFMRSDIDVLAMGDFVLHKSEQPEWKEGADWRNEYDLD